MWLGLLISICMEASSFSPEGVRRGGERAMGECFDLNGSIYHTCFGILKDNHEREREGEEGGEAALTCVAV